jgi:hypothetical protein
LKPSKNHFIIDLFSFIISLFSKILPVKKRLQKLAASRQNPINRGNENSGFWGLSSVAILAQNPETC